MVRQITLWYRSEVHRWRRGAAIAWGVCLVPIVTLAFYLLSVLDPVHPAAWIGGCVWRVFHQSLWQHILLLCAMFAGIAIWSSSIYSVVPQVLCTRLSYVRDLVSARRLGHLAVHCAVAGAATWSYLGLAGGRFSELSRPCVEDSPVYCLNEHHLFLVVHGVYVGLLFSIHFFLTGKNLLHFPVAQQPKFFRVKSAMFPTLVQSGKEVFKRLKYFYLVYYLGLGHILKYWIMQILNLPPNPTVAVDSLRGVLDPGLLWHGLLSGTLIVFSFKLFGLLYTVYTTELFTFPLDVCFEEDGDEKLLYHALACDTDPLVQYLAFLDLYNLSKQPSPRRQAMFELSQPGGHPLNWNAISSECLLSLGSLTSRVAQFNDRFILAGSVGHSLHGEVHADSTKTVTLKPSLSADQVSGGRLKPVSTWKDKMVNQLKKRRAVAFFVAELPDAACRKLFAQCQKQIWAAEALSHLVCASYTEDHYGVVQRSLPEVIAALLSLQEVVEKHMKLGINVTRKPPRDAEATEMTLRLALKSALRGAIYRITTKFHKHMPSIALNAEHSRRLQLYLDFKE